MNLTEVNYILAAIFGFLLSMLFWSLMELRQERRYWKECREAEERMEKYKT